jgi:hypothetical protein
VSEQREWSKQEDMVQWRGEEGGSMGAGRVEDTRADGGNSSGVLCCSASLCATRA